MESAGHPMGVNRNGTIYLAHSAAKPTKIIKSSGKENKNLKKKSRRIEICALKHVWTRGPPVQLLPAEKFWQTWAFISGTRSKILFFRRSKLRYNSEALLADRTLRIVQKWRLCVELSKRKSLPVFRLRPHALDLWPKREVPIINLRKTSILPVFDDLSTISKHLANKKSH